jgi:hypothetical protein
VVFDTVTTEVADELFPLTSVTVSVTVFAPELTQENELGETENEAMPQLSVEPLFTAKESKLT